jgi:hypothetical protein
MSQLSEYLQLEDVYRRSLDSFSNTYTGRALEVSLYNLSLVDKIHKVEDRDVHVSLTNVFTSSS